MSYWRTRVLKTADSILGPAVCSLLGSVGRLAGMDTTYPGGGDRNIRSILVIRPGGMGDMILLLPVLRLLAARFPAARITLICEKRNMEVLRVAGMSDMGLAYDRNPVGLLMHLASNSYDVALDTEQFHHFSAVFAFLSRARIRIGFKINPRRNPLYTHLVNYAVDGPEGLQFMRLVEPLGLKGSYTLAGSLSTADLQLPDVIAARLSDRFGDKPFAVVHPSGYTSQKRWPADSFSCLLRLLRSNHGMGAVLVGDRAERQAAASIMEQTCAGGSTILSCAGDLDLPATAALIKRARIFIGPDSGLAHLAVALGVKTVVLFGPSDHQKWGTTDSHHAVVRREMPCAPCFIFGYHRPCRTRECMTAISPEHVMTCIAKVLAAGEPSN